MTAPQVLILGLGYVGSGLANRIAAKHPQWAVTGTVRRGNDKISLGNTDATSGMVSVPTARSSFSNASASPTLYPLDARVEIIEYDGVTEYIASHDVTHILCTIPPSRLRREDSGEGSGGGNEEPLTSSHPSRILHQVEASGVWVGYVSTTSVYGDHGGALVDETSPLIPNRQNMAYIAEERAWLGCGGFHVDLFRCGGIYGPYRNVLDSLIRRQGSGTARRRRDKATTMRCHVLDVCRVIEKRMLQWEEGRSIDERHTHGVFNIVDDDPVGRRAVEDFVLHQSTLFTDFCALQSRENPTRTIGDGQRLVRTPADLRGAPFVGGLAEKRVSNRRIKDELGIELCFPSVRDGLEALVYRGDLRPFQINTDSLG